MEKTNLVIELSKLFPLDTLNYLKSVASRFGDYEQSVNHILDEKRKSEEKLKNESQNPKKRPLDNQMGNDIIISDKNQNEKIIDHLVPNTLSEGEH